MPFLYCNPNKTTVDQLELANLLGQCTGALATYDSINCRDTQALWGAAMPYLVLAQQSLPQSDALLNYQMAEIVRSYVTNAAQHVFESQAYQIPDKDLSVDTLNTLYAQVREAFGLGNATSDTSWVTDETLFVDAFSNFSSCVATTAAFDLYQMEAKQVGSGVDAYVSILLDSNSDTCVQLLQNLQRPSPLSSGQVARQIKAISQALRPDNT